MLTVRKMAPRDVPLAVAMETKSIPHDAWSEKDFDKALSSPNKVCLVAYLADNLVGHLIAVRGSKKMTLANLLVRRRYRLQGVGRRLIDEATKIANGRLMAAMVHEQNMAACKFFRSLGGWRCRLVPEYFNDSGADGYCFEKG